MTSPGVLVGEVVYGDTVPRLQTPPLVQGPPGPCGCGCALSPLTSYGFGAVDFARDTLLMPLDPWQRHAAIHAGELLPDGRPRFRTILIVVARQNGKTHLLVVLVLYWMFIEQIPTILGTSTQTKYAKEPWKKAHDIATSVAELDEEVPEGRQRGMRKAAGQEEWSTTEGSRYLVAASNEEGGRSLTLWRVIADEKARQFDYGAFKAAYYAMRAVPEAQYFALSTPLDGRSLPFNDMRRTALEQIEKGTTAGSRDGILEWSAPEDADPEDPAALAAANPNAGYRFPMEDLLNDARKAVATGGEALSGFKTESMCIAAVLMNPALDPAALARALVPGTLDGFRDRVAMVFDVAPSRQHCTLYAAAVVEDGKVRIAPVHEWAGAGCADRAAREIPALVRGMKVRPRLFGWFPGSPAAAVASKLKDRSVPGRRAAWPPHGVEVAEIVGDTKAVCMGFAELLDAGQLVRDVEPLFDSQAAAVEKLGRPGQPWMFSRMSDGGDADAVYAAAGASFLAQLVPPPVPRLRMVTVDDVTDSDG